MKEDVQIEHIREWISREKSFALYRIPGEEQIRIVGPSNEAVRLFSSIEALNEQKGFVIAPFKISSSTPLILIPAENHEWRNELSEISEIERKQSINNTVPSDDYKKRFEIFLQPLLSKELDKLVLSRQEKVEYNRNFSPFALFLRACKRYIRSYVYFCYTPQTGIWIGSTPEILLSGNKQQWHTVALAGTQPLQDGELPGQWDDKNNYEQRLVARYIQKQLATAGIRAKEEGPYSVRAGELAHLKSDFYFSLPDNRSLGNLLSLLHPTPAICGLPKEQAYRFILDHEGYDRRYYSGFIGWLDPDGQTDLYVNLRCMSIQQDIIQLYAGGGLLDSSILEEEWQETEDKLQTIKRLMDLY
ncbi:isochorismate synthase [Parabacteroides sp. PF5-9]|uniref:isochorismate synthase n=1 Tax=Parabacteroides sp. PF5-9 TaxID=1742404 RepID=UPI0024732053|nr:isochorismate synthase [Parabacteroides sp. PF5-9]MDH6358752.1 isochorismate synthase [Parabacteroides sp. PF5-9]